MSRPIPLLLVLVLALALSACQTPGQLRQQAFDDASEAAAEIADRTNELVDEALEDAGAIQEEALADAQAALDAAAEAAEQAELEALEELKEAEAGVLSEESGSAESGAEESGTEGTDDVSSATTAPAVTDGLNTADLPAVAAELAERLGPLTLLELGLTPTGGYRFLVRDPDMPENVDEYQWRGQFLDPVPVQLVGGGDLDGAVFSIDDVDLTAPARLVEAALDQGIEGAEVNVINLKMDPFRGLVWSVPISGTRESKVLFGRPDGTVLEVV